MSLPSTETPLVSIAIITYNQKEYLRECIESCLAQDYPNFEIVVADDCSTDGTQKMLFEYETQYPGKFVLRFAEKNQGITPNSNLAHFACSGKYIAWMGGDDLMLPKKISKQVKYMESNPECTICYHDLDVFDTITNKNLYYFSELNRPRQGNVYTAVRYGTFNGACSTMTRRSKAPENGFNMGIPVASDWLYWVETLANGGNINYINEVLGRYRRHQNNITKLENKIGQNAIDHLNSCNIIISKYPFLFVVAIKRYSDNLRNLRYFLPYMPVLLSCIRLSFDIKSLGALLIYICSFGSVKK